MWRQFEKKKNNYTKRQVEWRIIFSHLFLLGSLYLYLHNKFQAILRPLTMRRIVAVQKK